MASGYSVFVGLSGKRMLSRCFVHTSSFTKARVARLRQRVGIAATVVS